MENFNYNNMSIFSPNDAKDMLPTSTFTVFLPGLTAEQN